MKKNKLENDVLTLLHMLKKDWEGYEISYFEDDRINYLFNALYNNEYTYHCDENITKKIEDTINNGRDMFGIKVFQTNEYFHVLKQTKSKIVFMSFELRKEKVA